MIILVKVMVRSFLKFVKWLLIVQHTPPENFDFLLYLIPALDLVYKKILLVLCTGEGGETPPCNDHCGVLTPGCIWHQQVFANQFWSTPRVIITGEFRLPNDEYIGKS